MDLQEGRSELLKQLAREIWDRRVLKAIGNVPREFFVDPADQHLAYANIPLPIGQSQTISQPFIVALMTQSLYLHGHEKVLEIGTGSGYQTAILGEVAATVISIERYDELARVAQRRLGALGYRNVEIHVGDGTQGWPPEAPYEAIIVTAGAPRVPYPLLHQLADGGRLVIPVGSRFDQDLILFIRRGPEFEKRNLGPCRFVPLTGEEGWAAGPSG